MNVIKQDKKLEQEIDKLLCYFARLKAEGKKECSIKINQIPALFLFDNYVWGNLTSKFPKAWTDSGFDYMGMWVKIIK